jgi:hypothetical protein
MVIESLIPTQRRKDAKKILKFNSLRLCVEGKLAGGKQFGSISECLLPHLT